MKKFLLFLIAIILITVPFKVKAEVKCVYEWPKYLDGKDDWKIVLGGLDENNVFTTIVSGTNLAANNPVFADEVKLKDDGNCPDISFFHHYWTGKNEIYSSAQACLNDKHKKCINAILEEKDETGSSLYNEAENSQAILTNSTLGKCEYKSSFTGGQIDIIVKRSNDIAKTSCKDTSFGVGACEVPNMKGPIFFNEEGKFTCPKYIYYESTFNEAVRYLTITGKGGEEDENQSGEGENQISEEENDNTADVSNFCEEEKVQYAFRFVGYILLIVKILIPILLIIFGVIDYSKALITSNDSAIQKSTSSLITRLIAAVVIFLLPTIINFVFGLIPTAELNGKYCKCRTCIYRPGKCGKCVLTSQG